MRRLCEWKATPYTRKVISAHTSFGSHAQYRPQETFAQTAPRKMPNVVDGKRVYSNWSGIKKALVK